MDLEKISKYISYVLRHNPQDIGLELGERGFVNTSELISGVNEHFGKDVIDMDKLREIVATDNKQRYSFSEDESLIRANQGHSINVDLGLDVKEPPEFLYHGTSENSLDLIFKGGIKRMSRDYVHLSSDEETARTVGSRHGVSRVLQVNSGQMFKDGYKFYQSDNGVWLTDFVPVEYLVLL